MPGVLVICETKDGRLKKSSREALSAAVKLAAGDVAAVVLGADAGALAEDAGKVGAKRILSVDSPAVAEYSTEVYATVVKEIVDQEKPSVVLLPGSANGRDLAPRLAARLNAGVASDVTSLEWTGEMLRAKRPVYSGRAIATVEVDVLPAIATLRANAFGIAEGGSGAAEVVKVSANPPQPRAKVVETKVPEANEMSLAEADVIVSGGRGLKEAANFSLVRDLATALNAAVGASRAIVDAGWIEHQYQVGQTGRVVSPQLYIACGISGAIQHLAGMSSSKHIVAINKDPEAPIFRIADLGVVGDLLSILPLLTEEVKKARA